MVKFLVNQINLGNITILDVPPMWLEEVEREMKDGNKNSFS